MRVTWGPGLVGSINVRDLLQDRIDGDGAAGVAIASVLSAQSTLEGLTTALRHRHAVGGLLVTASAATLSAWATAALAPRALRLAIANQGAQRWALDVHRSVSHVLNRARDKGCITATSRLLLLLLLRPRLLMPLTLTRLPLLRLRLQLRLRLRLLLCRIIPTRRCRSRHRRATLIELPWPLLRHGARLCSQLQHSLLQPLICRRSTARWQLGGPEWMAG